MSVGCIVPTSKDLALLWVCYVFLACVLGLCFRISEQYTCTACLSGHTLLVSHLRTSLKFPLLVGLFLLFELPVYFLVL